MNPSWMKSRSRGTLARAISPIRSHSAWVIVRPATGRMLVSSSPRWSLNAAEDQLRRRQHGCAVRGAGAGPPGRQGGRELRREAPPRRRAPAAHPGHVERTAGVTRLDPVPELIVFGVVVIVRLSAISARWSARISRAPGRDRARSSRASGRRRTGSGKATDQVACHWCRAGSSPGSGAPVLGSVVADVSAPARASAGRGDRPALRRQRRGGERGERRSCCCELRHHLDRAVQGGDGRSRPPRG